ncbi:MAG: hypothetical protein AABX70_08110 [Nanoarchaeota archaeon]
MNKVFLTSLLLVVLLIAACQSSDTSYRQVRSVRGSTLGVNSDTPVETGASSEASSTLSDNPLKEQFRAYLQNPPTSKVSYTLQTTIQDKDQTQRFSGTQTVAIRGKDFVLQTTMGSESITTANYVLNGVYYACQTEKGEWTCYVLPKSEEDASPQIQQSIQDDLEKLDVQDAGQKTFLDMNTQCFKLSFQDPQTQEKGETIYCYDKNGVLLYSHTQTSAFQNTLEATAYAQPTEVDFQLPVEAKSLPLEEEPPQE